MKRYLSTALVLMVAAQHGYASSFEQRAAAAEREENRKEVADYLYSEMYPAIGSLLGGVMDSCLKEANASTAPFTVIAEVAEEGGFRQIDVAPKHSTALCFARKVAELKPPAPKKCKCAPLPVVIHMSVKP